jgi:SpoVK/Ycf46/Vps4 family AAA+-type ATPase
MKTQHPLIVSGIPDSVDPVEAAVLRSRLLRWGEEFRMRARPSSFCVSVGTAALPEPEPGRGRPVVEREAARASDELSLEERASLYRSEPPLYSFDFLIVPDEVQEEILAAVDLARVEAQVFDTWNLRSIEPFPRSALNLYGKPGTGKTLAAHAIASYLGRPILVASYAHVESKYHGEGPKNIEALFHAAERDRAVLFLDEADSLLSKRLTNVSQGSEQAINSMRSQLLVSLGNFHGLVIFATNLIVNYDEAFHTRMRNVRFPFPDEGARRRIWEKHLPAELPLASDVSAAELAKVDDVAGRDIKTAVIDAAVRTARAGLPSVTMDELRGALLRVKASRPTPAVEARESGEGSPLSPAELESVEVKVRAAVGIESAAN